MKRVNTAVWQEKKKYWRINVQKDGVRKSFYSTTPGRKGQRECNARADAWLEGNIDNHGRTLASLYDDYIESLRLTTSKSHWVKYESFGRLYIKPLKGRKKISSITEQDIQDIINHAFDKNGLSKKSLMNIRTCCMNFLKYCRKAAAIKLRPEDLEIPANAKIGTRRILQPDDLAILFNSDQTCLRGKEVFDIYIHAYRFAVLTGLRPGELRGLKLADISDGVVTVKRSINSLNEITKGKTKNAMRRFALTERAKIELEAQKALCKELYIESEYIFGDMSLVTFLKRFSRYCQHNGIEHTTLYELRHTFVSIAKKLPEGQIKGLVGHSANMDTFGVYGHEVAGELSGTALDVENLFENILNSGGNTALN